MDILGLAMADGADLRVHPTGKAVLAVSVQTQGQGHETTFAQLVAHELGLSPDDVEVVHGDTDRTPFGLGTYGSRSTPVSGAAAVVAARKVRERARLVAAAMFEASPDDLEWLDGKWRVRGDPDQALGIAEIAMAAHSTLELPAGVEGHLDASAVYNPPNLTFPFGAYICVTDVDPGTGEVKVRRFIAVDDCGVRINPMIVEGQVHRGLADGIGIALMQSIAFDEMGNCLSGSFMDYLLPTSLECPSPELGATVTPSPHHPVGAKGIGESATVGSPPAVVNSVIDALAPFGVVHADMPLTPANVWLAIQAAAPVPRTSPRKSIRGIAGVWRPGVDSRSRGAGESRGETLDLGRGFHDEEPGPGVSHWSACRGGGEDTIGGNMGIVASPPPGGTAYRGEPAVRRNARTARTRLFSVSLGVRPSLVKTLVTCVSTVRALR